MVSKQLYGCASTRQPSQLWAVACEGDCGVCSVQSNFNFAATGPSMEEMGVCHTDVRALGLHASLGQRANGIVTNIVVFIYMHSMVFM